MKTFVIRRIYFINNIHNFVIRKIYSTKTAPASIDANQPDIAVTTGFKAFFIEWFFIIWKDFESDFNNKKGVNKYPWKLCEIRQLPMYWDITKGKTKFNICPVRKVSISNSLLPQSQSETYFQNDLDADTYDSPKKYLEPNHDDSMESPSSKQTSSSLQDTQAESTDGITFDTVETTFGREENILGGSATYFSTSASFFWFFEYKGNFSNKSFCKFSMRISFLLQYISKFVNWPNMMDPFTGHFVYIVVHALVIKHFLSCFFLCNLFLL